MYKIIGLLQWCQIEVRVRVRAVALCYGVAESELLTKIAGMAR